MCDECADIKRRLADVERERDELQCKGESLCWAQGNTLMNLAASQAREARLREAGSALAHWATPLGSIDAMIQAEQLRLARVQWAALASAPGSMDALRTIVERAAQEARPGITWNECAAIVSRILGERSDDAPQGRGERAKGEGDA